MTRWQSNRQKFLSTGKAANCGKWLNKVHKTTVRAQLQTFNTYFNESFLQASKFPTNFQFLEEEESGAVVNTEWKNITEERSFFSPSAFRVQFSYPQLCFSALLREIQYEKEQNNQII